jgi:hypothetical protein
MSATPITDAAADPGWQFSKCAPDELVVPVDLARRLELDRAALMQALGVAADFIESDSPQTAGAIREVIAAARANF